MIFQYCNWIRMVWIRPLYYIIIIIYYHSPCTTEWRILQYASIRLYFERLSIISSHKFFWFHPPILPAAFLALFYVLLPLPFDHLFCPNIVRSSSCVTRHCHGGLGNDHAIPMKLFAIWNYIHIFMRVRIIL